MINNLKRESKRYIQIVCKMGVQFLFLIENQLDYFKRIFKIIKMSRDHTD